MLAVGSVDSAKNVSDCGKGLSLVAAEQHKSYNAKISQKLGVLDSSAKMGLAAKSLDKRLTLNVGGTKHETWASTLEMIPGTRLALLAHLQEADESYDFDTDEYFFDRHPTAFESIIQYYRNEELHVNQTLCGNVMKKELEFWGIEEQDIEACCWGDYSKFTEHKETLKDLDDNFFNAEDEAYGDQDMSKWRAFVSKTWRFLEEPTSSRVAQFYAVLSMSFVALSIAIFVLETHKLFQVDSASGISMATLLPEDERTPTDLDCCCETSPRNGTASYTAVTHPALRILDYICVGFFALEFIIRFAFCPNKLLFWRSALNVIDLVCLIPHFTAIIMAEVEPENAASDLVKTILMLRIVRILRIFKLMKHYSAFKILVYTIKVSTRELLLMIVFLMSGVLMFASIMHYAEKENFPNIPIGIWWALVTMTTVGYGDKYPVGYIGYGVGSICVICGVLVIAFTVPIVVNNFSLYYSHAQTRIKIPKRGKSRKSERGPLGGGRPKTGQSTSTNGSDFNSIPAFTPREPEDKKQLVNKQEKMNNLNIKVNEKKRYNFPDKGKQEKVIPHGKEINRSRTTPVETNDVCMEDIASIDSGIGDPNQQKKQYEEQTQRIMDDLVHNDQKFADERKRQEWLIKQKRDQRSRAAKQQREEQPGQIDASSADGVQFKGDKKKKKK